MQDQQQSHITDGNNSRISIMQLGVIPARYESGRFPGKPLVDILGMPMVVRTWQQAKKANSLDQVVIATDDERIADVCRKAGAQVIMTSKSCPNGVRPSAKLLFPAATALHKESSLDYLLVSQSISNTLPYSECL